uniref:Uncharacterized protein n=1 Tax=Arundo donax TaxID=35708 RepID=A0A0A8YY53_ARUDO
MNIQELTVQTNISAKRSHILKTYRSVGGKASP